MLEHVAERGVRQPLHASKPFTIDDYIKPARQDLSGAGRRSRPQRCREGRPEGLPGGCTRDIVHRFYQEQYQLDGGKQDRYVDRLATPSASPMGYYDTTAAPDLQVPAPRRAHRTTSIADHFFQARVRRLVPQPPVSGRGPGAAVGTPAGAAGAGG